MFLDEGHHTHTVCTLIFTDKYATIKTNADREMAMLTPRTVRHICIDYRVCKTGALKQ